MKKFVLNALMALLLSLPCTELMAQSKLWGTLPLGGSTEAGMVYQIDLDDHSMEEIYDFKQYLGHGPRNQVLLATNNKFYGIANGGYGQFGSFIYEYDAVNGEYIVVHDFYDTGVQHGFSAGSAYLMQASDGLVYGFTHNGGVNSEGQLFSYHTETGEFLPLADFEAAITGSGPIGGLVEGNDGKLYGLTNEGGGCNCGMLFSFDPATSLLQPALELTGFSGIHPNNGMIKAGNGMLYGMIREGGANSMGTLFSYETGTGIFTNLHDFNPLNDGGRPYGRLFQASDGHLYGMTSEGGALGEGVIFRYNINLDIFNVIYSFDGANGSFPLGSLIEHEGSLFGMTANGGVADKGILFRFDHSSNTLVKLVDMYGEDYGEYPDGTLSLGPDGKLYGQAYSGGKYDAGIMFVYDLADMTFTKCFDFESAADGAISFSGLMMASDGMIYGTTQYGGQYRAGTIYRINPANRQFELIFEFDLFSSGGGPMYGLMQAADGFLYGATPFGGTVNSGALYRMDPNSGVYTVIHDIITPSEGNEPGGIPVEATDGMLYGTTRRGGANDEGAIYKFNLSTSVYAKQADFESLVTGKYPAGSMIKAANGKLYGVTHTGGPYNNGSIFEYDLASGTLQAVVHFDGLNKGRIPTSTLLEYEDNMLYGMCHMGGLYDAGTIFVLNLQAGLYTKLMDLDPATTGCNPYSALMKASNGKIYGTTRHGGASDCGVIFEYDPATGDYIHIHEFNSFREYPWFSPLLEVESEFGVDEYAVTTQLSCYPNPVSDRLTLKGIAGSSEISIHNQLGMLVYLHSCPGNDGITELDVAGLEPGIYIAGARGKDGRTACVKFLKME